MLTAPLQVRKMVDSFIRGILGEFGSNLLDFYREYSLWINGIILLYFLLVVLAWGNYRRILQALSSQVMQEYTDQLSKKKTQQEIEAFLKKKSIPWETCFTISRYPFVTPPGRFTLYLKTKSSMPKLFPVELLAQIIGQQGKAEGQ